MNCNTFFPECCFFLKSSFSGIWHYICSCLMFRDKKKFDFHGGSHHSKYYRECKIFNEMRVITTIEGLKLKNCHCRLHSIKSISHAYVQNHFLAIFLSDHSGHEKQWLWLSSGTVFTFQCPPDQGQSILPTNIQRPSHISGFPIVHFVPEKWWEYSDGSK